ncbi:MAG: hypothetical protein GX964_05070 [Syntrophomonadaceae bacterium]|jgi:nitrogen-specific signal transduction histidine kinase|nr:hypothetical protein [Syntrophomonadaceae bacterium]
MADILDNVPLGILVYNEKPELTYCNRTGYALFSQLGSSRASSLSDQLKALVHESLITNDITNDSGMDKLIHLHDSNHYSVYRATGNILHTTNPYVMVTLRDETINTRLKQTLLKAENLSVVGQMAVGTITRIINPLTAAHGMCQMLINNQGEPGEFIGIIGQELELIKKIIDDFTRLPGKHNN